MTQLGPRTSLYFNFHDYTILVGGNDTAVLEKLRQEFHFFEVATLTGAQTTLTLERGPAPPLPSLVAERVLEQALVYRLGPKQYNDYNGQALVIRDEAEDTVSIYSEDPDRLYELAFLAVHSLLGQALDLKGLCRVHALGISLGRLNAVVMLPSKGGKSTLLRECLEHPDVRIISDDMPLVDRHGSVHPFPSKLSLGERPSTGPLAALTWTEFKRTQFPPKWTAGLSQLEARLERQSRLNQTLVIAGFRLSTGTSFLEPVPKVKMLKPLLEHMVVGVGLPQVVELFLRFRPSDAAKLAKHALLRSLSALMLVLRSPCYHFYLGPDTKLNAQLLLDELHARQHS